MLPDDIHSSPFQPDVHLPAPQEKSGYKLSIHPVSIEQEKPAYEHLILPISLDDDARTLSIHSLVSTKAIPNVADLERSEATIGELLELVGDKAHLTEHLRHLMEKSEEFINFILVKQAGAMDFGMTPITAATKKKEDRLIDLGLQFLRGDTLEWQMDFASFLDLSQSSSPSATGASNLDFAVAFLNSLGHAGSIFLMGIHLRKAMEVLEVKEKALLLIDDPEKKANIEKEIAILKEWIESNRNVVLKGLKSEALALAISTPKLISALTSMVAGAGTMTATVFDWIGLGIDLVGSAFRMKKAHSDNRHYTHWAEAFKGSTLTAEKLTEIVKNQESGFEKKLQNNLPKLILATNEAIQRKYEGEEFSGLIENLKKIGWDIPETIESQEQLDVFLSDEENIKAANEKKVKRSEGISASLRNAFRALASYKASVDVGFVKLRFHRAKALFSTASVLTGLMIALKVAAVAGVVLAASALVVVGYGMLVATVGAIIIGGIYLRVKKPNLFREHWKGVKTKLLLRKVPLIIQNFRLQRATMESSKFATSLLVKNIHKAEIEALILQISSMNTPTISDEMKKRIKALKKAKNDDEIKMILEKALTNLQKKIVKEKSKFDSLQKKIDRLAVSVDHHESKALTLQQRLDEAGWKDYLWNLNKKHHGYGEEVVITLAENLMSDPDLLDDPDTKELLEHLDINLEELRHLPDATEKLFEVADAICRFFASEDEETIKRIRARKMVVKHG